MIFFLISILSCNLTATIIYVFLTGTIDISGIIAVSEDNFILPSVFLALLFSLTIIFIAGIFISHRMAGPIYRFEKAIEDVSNKDLTGNFKLRKHDEFKKLADLINNMVRQLNFELIQAEKKLGSLKDYADNMDMSDADDIKKMTENMKKTIYELTKKINEFKLKG